MNDAPSPAADRAISCAIAVTVLCLTLLVLGLILMSFGSS